MTNNPLKKRIQHQAYSLVVYQLIGVVLLASVFLLFNGKTSGFSVLTGGLAYGLPNLLFVWIVFRFVGAQQMGQFAMAFMAGEIIKLVISAFLFLVIVKTLAVSLLSVLVGFIGAIVSFWIVCMLYFSRKKTIR